MKFFCLRNIVSNDVFNKVPWDFKSNIPADVNDKEARRKWWKTPTTNHLFYNMFEGQHASLRISENNPPIKMYGFVVDYDATITQEMYDAPVFDKINILPYAWSMTSGGRGRMVWVFEQPLPLPDMRMTTQFLKIIAKDLSLKTIWPGFDEAFYKSTQYYEVGHSWNVSTKIKVPHAIVISMMSKAWEAMNKKVTLALPLEQIYTELERKYPKEWVGPFELGSRTKRFWDNDAKNPTSAILRANGFQCFSGPKAFVTWAELLGDTFVRAAEADRMKETSDGIFFDDKTYFRKSDNGDWITYNKEDIKLYLKVRLGITNRAASQHDASDLERTMCFIQDAGRIECAMPMVQNKPGLIFIDNRRYLNISTIHALQPAPDDANISYADFPWLGDFFENFFDDKYQLPYFFAWLKRFYEAGLYYKPCSGQAIFLAGNKNKGKTMLADYIVAKMVGGFRDASSFLMGESGDFTAPFLEVPLLTVNDTTVSTDEQRHTRYSSILKKMVANKDFLYNQKYEKAGSVKWMGRIIITCNTDPESMRVLPNVEMSLMDKIMLFKTSDTKKNFYDGFISKIDQELPYFCRWLLCWAYPPHIVDDARFGVKPFHHKELFQAAMQSGQSQAFLELLQIFIRAWATDYKKVWEGTAGKLASDMMNCQATAPLAYKFGISKMGSLLGQLRARGYPLINKHTRKGNIWEIPCDTTLLECGGVKEDEGEPVLSLEEESRHTSPIFQDGVQQPVRAQSKDQPA
jgi:hypothetical protein